LEKILASRCFGRSPRLSRFLRFLVENALAGTTGNLKEYAIGIDVFDRDPSYDSRLDPIVRVEAGVDFVRSCGSIMTTKGAAIASGSRFPNGDTFQ